MAVYVVQEAVGKNLLPAAKFGELRPMLDAGLQINLDAGPATAILRESLKTFSDGDYLLAIGDPAAIGIAVALAARGNAGRVRLLKWDRQERQYYPVQIDIGR